MEGAAPAIGPSYTERYEALLERLAERCAGSERSLCAFWPVRGERFRPGETLVVDRVATGWGGPDLAFRLADLRSPERRREVLERAREHGEATGLGWLTERAGAAGPFDPSRSPFWRAVHEVTDRLAGPSGPTPWPESLAWSCLYKVAPLTGGNPTGPLRDEQRDGCAALLEAEVAAWEPDLALCLTGWRFSEPVLSRLALRWTPGPPGSPVERLAEADATRWIVTAHPQTRDLEELVAAVVEEVAGSETGPA